jgi:hypothetical protein
MVGIFVWVCEGKNKKLSKKKELYGLFNYVLISEIRTLKLQMLSLKNNFYSLKLSAAVHTLKFHSRSTFARQTNINLNKNKAQISSCILSMTDSLPAYLFFGTSSRSFDNLIENVNVCTSYRNTIFTIIQHTQKINNANYAITIFFHHFYFYQRQSIFMKVACKVSVFDYTLDVCERAGISTHAAAAIERWSDINMKSLLI